MAVGPVGLRAISECTRDSGRQIPVALSQKCVSARRESHHLSADTRLQGLPSRRLGVASRPREKPQLPPLTLLYTPLDAWLPRICARFPLSSARGHITAPYNTTVNPPFALTTRIRSPSLACSVDGVCWCVGGRGVYGRGMMCERCGIHE